MKKSKSDHDTNPHSPPGPYILFDNLDKTNRLFFNVWLQYDSNSSQDGMYMKYLYIYHIGHTICIDLWNMNLIKITNSLSTDIEWDKIEYDYTFDDALKSRSLVFNKKRATYYEYINLIEFNKKIRNYVFSSGNIKTLSSYSTSDSSFSYSHQLVVDEARPTSDREWDISENVKLRFRIDFNIDLGDGKSMQLMFDRGTRGLPSIKPVGWYPTRDMDGILISKEKANPIPYFTYQKKIV